MCRILNEVGKVSNVKIWERGTQKWGQEEQIPLGQECLAYLRNSKKCLEKVSQAKNGGKRRHECHPGSVRPSGVGKCVRMCFVLFVQRWEFNPESGPTRSSLCL